MLEKIVAAWEPVYDESEVVVIEAVSPGPARLYAAEFNQALAQALDADVVLAGRWPPAAALGLRQRVKDLRTRRVRLRARPGMPPHRWPSRSPSRRAVTSPARRPV